MSSKDQSQDKAGPTSRNQELRPEIQDLETSTWKTAAAAIVQRARQDPAALSPRDVLQLQRTVGNRVVSRLLAQTARPQPVRADKSSNVQSDEPKTGIENLSGIPLGEAMHRKPVTSRAFASGFAIIQRMVGGGLEPGTPVRIIRDEWEGDRRAEISEEVPEEGYRLSGLGDQVFGYGELEPIGETGVPPKEKEEEEDGSEYVDQAMDMGFGDRELATERVAEGLRYDPNSNKWVQPQSADLWADFARTIERAKGKFKLPYLDWEAKRAAKAAKAGAEKIPIDVEDDAQIQALWGGEARFNKWERAKAIRKMFTDAGFKAGPIEESKTSSSKTPPVLFTIEDHRVINLFEIHPGGGIHKGPYIRISSNKGLIKLINNKSDPPYDSLGQTRDRKVEVSIEE